MPDDNSQFPGQDDAPAEHSYVLPRSQKAITPPARTGATDSQDAALAVIRSKLERLYAEAPDPFAKAAPAAATAKPHSKHQQFMLDLQTSGRSLADIQTAWHNYYVGLPDDEKHQVWHEFYEAHDAMRHRTAPKPQPGAVTNLPRTSAEHVALTHQAGPAVVGGQAEPQQTPQQLRDRIRRKVSANGRLKARHHLQSLGFGLAIGFLTLVITLFSFFNEVIVAPFIQPGRAEGATPIIIDPSTVAVGSMPEIIIPKINLEIPVDYTQTSDDENTIQNALEKGIVHYPSTVLPGQNGNAAFFGHSSNNIFNPGKYKFAFVLLHELQPGDTFYLTYNHVAYVYKVFRRIIVSPDQVGVLDNVRGHRATATLITCDPPGTALNRLVIVGDQISPDPAHNRAGQNSISSDSTVTALPDNGPSLWDRITSFLGL